MGISNPVQIHLNEREKYIKHGIFRVNLGSIKMAFSSSISEIV